eukprot:4435127-Karenia_brevis.AAC.1
MHGKSLTLVLMSSGVLRLDPIFKASEQPIVGLSEAYWDGWMPPSILRKGVCTAATECTVRGPFSAAVQAMSRLGWRAGDVGDRWFTDEGE